MFSIPVIFSLMENNTTTMGINYISIRIFPNFTGDKLRILLCMH